jgi:hypothetical protein
MSLSYSDIHVVNAVNELNETIKSTNKETSSQNKIMIRLTISIVILTIVMVIPIIHNAIAYIQIQLNR